MWKEEAGERTSDRLKIKIHKTRVYGEDEAEQQQDNVVDRLRWYLWWCAQYKHKESFGFYGCFVFPSTVKSNPSTKKNSFKINGY